MSAAHGKQQARLIEVRESRRHGLGVLAARRIVKGTRVMDYPGERVTHAQADRRYAHKDAGDNCRYGLDGCRGTMLWPAPRAALRSAARVAAERGGRAA